MKGVKNRKQWERKMNEIRRKGDGVETSFTKQNSSLNMI